MKKWQKIIFNVCRIILGIVFIFSSFVKGIDPLGFAYKIHDYFVAAHLPQLNFSSLFLSYTLNGIEFLIGIALILGLFFNYTALATLAFMIFYTILTFILALFNPVSDCGCFGDAIKLTNWETFFKNVILLALIVYVFLNRKKFNIKLSPKYQYITIGIYIIVFYSISFYSYRHLPFFDFMPYSVGSNIKEKMTVPAGMPVDEYQTQLLYRNKNTKEVKSFTLENYPWQDTLNWEWVETKSVLVKKGYEPPIHDFDLTDSHGNNLNDSILNFKGYVFLFISDKLNKVDTKSLFFADTLSMFCSSNPNTRFYALTASTEHEQQKIIKQFNLSFTFGNGDETMLKTVIRSNPGIVILSNGTVIAKYSHHDFYKIKFKNDELILSSVLTSQRQKTEILYSFIFIFLLILLTFFIKEYLVPEN